MELTPSIIDQIRQRMGIQTSEQKQRAYNLRSALGMDEPTDLSSSIVSAVKELPGKFMTDVAKPAGNFLLESSKQLAKAPVKLAMVPTDLLSTAVTGKPLPRLNVPGVGDVESYSQRALDLQNEPGHTPLTAGAQAFFEGMLDASVAGDIATKATTALAKTTLEDPHTVVSRHLDSGRQVEQSLGPKMEAQGSDVVSSVKRNIVDGMKERYPELSQQLSKIDTTGMKSVEDFASQVDDAVNQHVLTKLQTDPSSVTLFRGGGEGSHYTTNPAWAKNFGDISQTSLPEGAKVHILTTDDMQGLTSTHESDLYEKLFQKGYDVLVGTDQMNPSALDVIVKPGVVTKSSDTLLGKAGQAVTESMSKSINEPTIGLATKRVSSKLEPFHKPTILDGQTYTESGVPQSEYETVKKLYDDRYTMQQIGDRYGVTRQRIEQILKNKNTQSFEEIPENLRPLAQEAQKYKTAEEFVKAQQKDTLYHGASMDLGDNPLLKRGYGFGDPGKYTGQDYGGIFFTPSEKYALQYAGSARENALYSYKLTGKENIFDISNPDAIKQFIENAKNWEGYSSPKIATDAAKRIVENLKETAQHGAADWATLAGYENELEMSGFHGAKLLERAGENIEPLADGSFKVTGKPVYSYGLFKGDIPVQRALTESQLTDLWNKVHGGGIEKGALAASGLPLLAPTGKDDKTGALNPPKELKPMLDKAYQTYPEVPRGLIEAVLMQESSMGTNDKHRNDDAGKYGWLLGITKDGTYGDMVKNPSIYTGLKDVEKWQDIDKISSAIAVSASILAQKIRNNFPNGVNTPEDALKLYDTYYKTKSGAKLTKDQKQAFKQYFTYYQSVKSDDGNE